MEVLILSEIRQVQKDKYKVDFIEEWNEIVVTIYRKGQVGKRHEGTEDVKGHKNRGLV